MAVDQDNAGDAYPNRGEHYLPTVPAAQVAEHDEEEAEVIENLPLIERVVAHFTERIKARDSISAINVDIAEDPELHQKTCAVNDMIAKALAEEKKELEELIRNYISE